MQAKYDVNHKPLTALLRRAGRPFVDVARHRGFGCDIVAQHRDGYVMFIEIKKPGPPHCRKLTESEETLRSLFPDFFRVVQSEEELLAAVGLAS